LFSHLFPRESLPAKKEKLSPQKKGESEQEQTEETQGLFSVTSVFSCWIPVFVFAPFRVLADHCSDLLNADT
jgi:hypothetical protein